LTPRPGTSHFQAEVKVLSDLLWPFLEITRLPQCVPFVAEGL
jgi:hypothetical protein